MALGRDYSRSSSVSSRIKTPHPPPPPRLLVYCTSSLDFILLTRGMSCRAQQTSPKLFEVYTFAKRYSWIMYHVKCHRRKSVLFLCSSVVFHPSTSWDSWLVLLKTIILFFLGLNDYFYLYRRRVLYLLQSSSGVCIWSQREEKKAFHAVPLIENCLLSLLLDSKRQILSDL